MLTLFFVHPHLLGKNLVLEQLMGEFKELRNNSTRVNQSSSVVAESMPWANNVRFIVDIPISMLTGQGRWYDHLIIEYKLK